MLKNKIMTMVLALGTFAALAAPSAALARDNDRNDHGRNDYGRNSHVTSRITAQQRRAYEERVRREAQERWQREHRSTNRYQSGYYDRFGRWQANEYPQNRW